MQVMWCSLQKTITDGERENTMARNEYCFWKSPIITRVFRTSMSIVCMWNRNLECYITCLNCSHHYQRIEIVRVETVIQLHFSGIELKIGFRPGSKHNVRGYIVYSMNNDARTDSPRESYRVVSWIPDTESVPTMRSTNHVTITKQLGNALVSCRTWHTHTTWERTQQWNEGATRWWESHGMACTIARFGLHELRKGMGAYHLNRTPDHQWSAEYVRRWRIISSSCWMIEGWTPAFCLFGCLIINNQVRSVFFDQKKLQSSLDSKQQLFHTPCISSTDRFELWNHFGLITITSSCCFWTPRREMKEGCGRRRTFSVFHISWENWSKMK